MHKKSLAIDTWEICGFDPDTYKRSLLLSGSYDGEEWLSTGVPKDVHSILIDNKKIQHPYYKTNDLECQWVEKKVWVYRTNINVTEDMIEDRHLILKLEGADTYATVILNGKEAAYVDNMLVEHEIDITDMVRIGENTLILEFDVMSKRAAQKELPEGFWINYSTERAYARKAAYQYGWDWNSRMATVGLWKPVWINSYKNGRINSVQITATDIKIDEKKAKLNFVIDSSIWGNKLVSYKIEIKTPDGDVKHYETKDKAYSISMENVRFWWTHDLGNPDLYTITVSMVDGEDISDCYTCEYGIRKLELKLSTEDRKEKRFLFELNEVPLMARGANWVPVSNFLSSAEDERYTALIGMAKKAHMNMLSLWGGGIYEKDIFYKTCDREGILVWQYFMFACGEYPDYDREYVEHVKEEVEKAVVRLRNYACICLWAGNVEGDMICEKIGLQREMYGKKLFWELIPEWLKDLDTTRHYIPSSPWSETGPANDWESGDSHNWDVWFKDIPYTHYSLDTSKFCSEYGIHAAPVRQTIAKYIGEDNADLNNFYFKYMNKDQSLARMEYYMEQHIGIPKNLDEYIDYSMFVQAEGLKYGSEHYRRRFPATAGALIWQLNDCIPVHSWSLVDYDLIPKASYYYSKRFFAPSIISLEEIDDSLTGILVINNRNENLHEVVKITVKDFLGNCFHEEEIEVNIPANTVMKIKELRVGGRFYPNVIIPNRHRMFYLAAEGSKHLSKSIRYFGKYQEIAFPPAKIEVERLEDAIRIRTDNFARFVKIDGEIAGWNLSDNYFDMEAGETREIQLEGNGGSLYVKALNSTSVFL